MADPKEIDMAKLARVQVQVSKPYTSEGLKGNSGWHGVPGARHIPPSSDPSFPRFTFIVSEWAAAGIEMTDDLMAAAAQLARAQSERQRQQDAGAVQREARFAASAAAAPPPAGAFGDEAGGVVYYARRAEYVKIGTTTRLRTRMRDLMPDEILAVEPGSYTLERQLHGRFAGLRISPDCEYFRLDRELQVHIAGVVERCGPPPEGLSHLKGIAGS